MAGWNPWAAARAVPHLEIWFADVPDGATWHRDHDGDHITIDAAELVHVERGVGYPAATAATMEREEAIVRRVVAVRLVPLDALSELVARRSDVEPITEVLVAEEFDVPEDIAREALLALRQRRST
jgi:hypothetical protein